MPRKRKDGAAPKAAAKRELTDRFVKSVEPDPDRRTRYWDTKVGGLLLQVEPSGNRSYVYCYRAHGRVRWYRIEDATKISLKDARATALGLNADRVKAENGTLVDSNGKRLDFDPARTRKAKREAGTFGELAEQYIAWVKAPADGKPHRLKSWAQSEYKIRKYLLPRWKNRPAASIERSDVRAMFNAVSASGAPIAANQALAQAAAVFTWAIKNEIGGISFNPAHGIERNQRKDRERVLGDFGTDEVARFWTAFDGAGLECSTALKLILLTGQRPGEVCAMRREEVQGHWWHMRTNKRDKPHLVYLTQPVLDLLSEFDEESGEYIFTAPGGDQLEPQHLETAMREICLGLELVTEGMDEAERDRKKVTPHDLRRTHGTTITSLGFSREQMNRIQNHAEGGIGKVYDRHHYRGEFQRIQEAVAERILALAAGKAESDNVVRIEAA